MLKQRVLSALIGIPMLIAVGVYSGIPLKVAMFLLAAIAYREFNKANSSGQSVYLDLIGYLYIAVFFVLNEVVSSDILVYVYFIILMTFAILNRRSVNAVFLRIAGFIYAVIPFVFLLRIRDVDAKLFWLVFIIAFSTDTFAYFIGRFFGRKKLCPDVSPNKTVEGFVGGVVGCVITVYFYAMVYLHSSYVFLIISFVGSVVSQIGDLSASYIKRNCKIKDFGNVIPGHGGVLDRFDSIIYVSVVIYFLADKIYL